MRRDERVINDMKDINFSVQDILNIILKTIKEPKHKYTIECIDMFNTIYILQQRIDKAIEYIKHIDDWDIKDFVREDILEILGDKE